MNSAEASEVPLRMVNLPDVWQNGHQMQVNAPFGSRVRLTIKATARTTKFALLNYRLFPGDKDFNAWLGPNGNSGTHLHLDLQYR